MEPTTSHPGEQIRRRREALNMRREALAFKAEISLKTVELIEGGKVEPRRTTLAAIERALEGEPTEAAA